MTKYLADFTELASRCRNSIGLLGFEKQTETIIEAEKLLSDVQIYLSSVITELRGDLSC